VPDDDDFTNRFAEGPPPPRQKWQWVQPRPLPDCLTCAKSDLHREVILDSDGGLTALCQMHSDFEIDWRRRLRAGADKHGTVTVDQAKGIRLDAVNEARRRHGLKARPERSRTADDS
jgi:hypothetical protein